VTPFTECTSIESWFKELSGVSIMLTLDTGPMHLADALQIPVIALFGSGLLPLWAPSGEYSRVVTHQNDPDFAFYPATDANIEYAQRLMRRITVVEVLNAVDDLIESLPKLT
jgi:ADP-heptose:LPS heptosyltransferase